MLERKTRRVYDTLRLKHPGLEDLELRAMAIHEVSGVPIADCRDQLVYWATGNRPEVPLMERCTVPHCTSRASKITRGAPFCWPHLGEWTASDEWRDWESAGAKPEEKQAALYAFASRYG